jgi:hypothetical protein
VYTQINAPRPRTNQQVALGHGGIAEQICAHKRIAESIRIPYLIAYAMVVVSRNRRPK